MDNLESISEGIRQTFHVIDEAREKALPLCRDAIRYCSNAIRAMHRGEFDQAMEFLKTARGILDEAEWAVAPHVELGSTGLIRDAQKEYAEGNIALALVTGQALPGPEELGVSAAAYLNGMGEAVGELRRYLLDSMRQGDLTRGEELLADMDEVYNVLVTMDFPDAITGGLRRTTDMVRAVLERTRSDLTLTIRQKDLEIKLEDLQPEEVEESPRGELNLNENETLIYEDLVTWRGRKASEENLAPFIIARDSWLKEIIKLNPATPRDLIGIKGFGDRRAGKYGKEILRILKRETGK